MPKNVIDFSALSSIIYDEPWHLHFWESTITEYFIFLQNPQKFLKEIGIDLPSNLRIETILTNNELLVSDDPVPVPCPTPGSSDLRLTSTYRITSSDNPVVCNIGSGSGNVAFYRVTSFIHDANEVGKLKKSLLHDRSEEKKPNT